jgi:uncharacterized protein with gpF-like domain
MKRNLYKRTFIALHGRNERLLAQGIRSSIRAEMLKQTDLNIYSNVMFIDSLPFDGLQQELRKGYERSGQIGSMVYRDLEDEKKRMNPFFSAVWNAWIVQNSERIIGQRIVSIKDTLKKDLIKEINRAISENADLFDVTKVIQDFVKKPDFYRYQAQRIARTETTTAMNNAMVVAGDESRLILNKVWLTAGDGEVRDSHAALDGVSIPKDDFFENGLQYPGDPTGDAAEVINCRCTITYEPVRDGNGNLILN